MPRAKRAENPTIMRTISRFSEGTKIPKILISAIPIIADVLDISNPLPGRDDQKMFSFPDDQNPELTIDYKAKHYEGSQFIPL